MKNSGFVYIVGAGPGDVELMTVKALRCLQQADVVLYDRLVSADILDLIPHGVSRIAVGKAPGNHCVPQSQINDIIVSLARAGRKVVRLKGGDPYMFGRGGEEALTLKQHDIEFEIIPGITAASGSSAYAGIPLTHRGMSRRVQFITGHYSNDEPLDIDWNKVADPDSTIVIYMGLANLDEICQRLMQAGLAGNTPAAAIENATAQNQQRVIAQLDTLPATVRQHQLATPVIVIVGQVVTLADELDWFQHSLEGELHESNAVGC
jgi:uroporphyrin-III C-methyltransferase/precorrin-2 dehydrogenase/sirohydrochlorin ferrochelatase/uroporphyrin-III C-methyltransferase